MKASRIKAKWKNVTKSWHKGQDIEYWELRGTDINKCFGKLQIYNRPTGKGYVFVRAMISTEDPFITQIPYTKDFKVINKAWESLMNDLLDKIFDTKL